MLSLKPDIEASLQRIEAFWERQILDRPLVQFSLYKPPAKMIPLPVSNHASPAERWLDIDFRAELALAHLSNQLFLGDTLPVAWPNLGPDAFASFYGCPLEFGDYGTSWSQPICDSIEQVQSLRLDWDSPTLKTIERMTDLLLEIGQGRFITGMTDLHPGADCLAALHGSQNLAMDLLDLPTR